VPTVRRRHSAVVTGLIVGAFWGLWHVLPKIRGAAAHGIVAYMPADLLSAPCRGSSSRQLRSLRNGDLVEIATALGESHRVR